MADQQAQSQSSPLGGLFGKANPVGAVVSTVTDVFKAFSEIKLKKEWQKFKIALAEQEQKFQQQLSSTAQAQTSANQSQQTLQDLYLSSSKNSSNSLLIASGIIVVGGLGLILILSKKSS
jgi:hypothetical protein